MTEIRKARESDKERLVEILRGTYLGTMAAIVPPEALEAFNRNNEAARFVENCWQDFDVLCVDDEVMGMLFVVDNVVESLHIHPNKSGKGFGATLLSFGEKKIAANSDTAELDVLSGNTNAITFYERRNWKKSHEYEGMEAGDVPAKMYRMKKNLK